MLFSTTSLSIAMLATLAMAAPSSLESRQGGFFVAVGTKYSGPGCTGEALGDPIFGNGNVCQPLDRFGDGAPIVSYETVSVSAGCSGKLITLRNCDEDNLRCGQKIAENCDSHYL
jgi:hypothetical protein